MSNTTSEGQAMASSNQPESTQDAIAFTFDSLVPINDRRIFDSMECYSNGTWYEPPIPPQYLANSLRAAVHHESAIWFKVNVLVSCFKAPSSKLSRAAFKQLVLDYVVTANCYLEKITNMRGQVSKYAPALSAYTRRAVNSDGFYFVRNFGQPYEFKNDVFHVRESDLTQEIYGVPQYMSALQSAALNESATLFRRKYYQNGNHAGFILHVTDQALNPAGADALEAALKKTRGVGNFSNIFLHTPSGKTDTVKLIPISEVTAKDEFLSIKNVTAEDQLAAHRVPPALMGIVAKASGGHGSIEQAAKVFARNELEPIIAMFKDINDWAGETIIDFDEYQIEKAVTAEARK